MRYSTVNRTGCCLLVATALLLAGCTTHTRNSQVAMNRLKAGDTAAALKWAEKTKRSSLSQELGTIESGRIKMLSGDFAGSRADFETEIDRILDETETGPVLRLSSVGASAVTATITDDTVRKYRLSPYEMIQLLHYQTLNYLFSGDIDGAGVEMRRTVFAQDAIAETCSKEIKKQQEKIGAEQAGAMATVENKMAALGPVMERTRSSYENGLAWYFCGLLFEKQGDDANAALCYRKAWELAPENRCILTDFLRMLRTQDPQSFAAMTDWNSTDLNSLTRDSTEIVVLYEESLISQRRAEKVQIPIPDPRGAMTIIAIDFPFYTDSAYTPRPMAISNGGVNPGFTEPAVYLQSLAYRDLKEKMPGIVFRNVTRSITKVAAQQAVNNQNNAQAQLGMMVINAVASLASTADTRAWYSIPMVTHVYRSSIQPGSHVLQCRPHGAATALTIPVTVADGETRLVWIADTGGIAVAATATLSGKGLPPTYQQFNNPFYNSGASVFINQPAAQSVGAQ